MCIRDSILLVHWDPIGIEDEPWTQDEYDSYIPQIYRLLVDRTDEAALAAHLLKIERDSMGLEGSEERATTTAAKLLKAMAD